MPASAPAPRPSKAASPPSPPFTPASAGPDGTPQRWQFSLRTLLIAVTAACFIAFLAPWAAAWGVFDVAVAISLGSAACYARGQRQTFFAGACAAALIEVLRYEQRIPFDPFSMLIMNLKLLVTCIACGALALAVRRFVERRGWHLPESGGEASVSARDSKLDDVR